MSLCFYTTESLRKSICSNCNKWNSRTGEMHQWFFCAVLKISFCEVAVPRSVFSSGKLLGASLCNYISVENFSQGKELQFFRSQCSFLCGAVWGYTCLIKNLINNLCFFWLLCLISISFHTSNSTWISWYTCLN